MGVGAGVGEGGGAGGGAGVLLRAGGSGGARHPGRRVRHGLHLPREHLRHRTRQGQRSGSPAGGAGVLPPGSGRCRRAALHPGARPPGEAEGGDDDGGMPRSVGGGRRPAGPGGPLQTELAQAHASATAAREESPPLPRGSGARHCGSRREGGQGDCRGRWRPSPRRRESKKRSWMPLRPPGLPRPRRSRTRWRTCSGWRKERVAQAEAQYPGAAEGVRGAVRGRAGGRPGQGGRPGGTHSSSSG
eukprot:jgi/Botrbrau1/1554/Bobra.0107s0042.1